MCPGAAELPMTTTDEAIDLYETLQVSPNADSETIQRVYRLLARRFHPDNHESGDELRFRELPAAYAVLSASEQPAAYDVTYDQRRQRRWRLVSTGHSVQQNFHLEQALRLTMLEILYTRRLSSRAAGVSLREVVELTGAPREKLEFAEWYLAQKELVTRGDSSDLMITAAGVDYLESNYEARQRQLMLPSPEDSVPM